VGWLGVLRIYLTNISAGIEIGSCLAVDWTRDYWKIWKGEKIYPISRQWTRETDVSKT
jgi:hypothetical protein